MISTVHRTNYSYKGNELDIFRYATNYKHYVLERLLPYLGQSVLEVGAGIGGTTRVLTRHDCDYWMALEPDPALILSLQQQQAAGQLPDFVDIQQGIVQDLASDARFDTVLYIDVLEHIEHHRQELKAASERVAIGGHIIVLSPAFQFLYTPFDEAIGHYRRYRRNELYDLTPANCKVASAFYLDAVGMLASAANLLFLQSSQPDIRQIKFWDRMMIPVSRVLDPLIGYAFGRSVICIYERVS